MGHFFEEGLIYYDIAVTHKKGNDLAIKFGQWTEGIAPKSLTTGEWNFLDNPGIFVNFAGNSIRPPGLLSSRELFGILGERGGIDPNGDSSPADLAANESGFKFFQDLYKGNYEKGGIGPGRFDIKRYVNSAWDYTFKPNQNVISDPKPPRP